MSGFVFTRYAQRRKMPDESGVYSRLLILGGLDWSATLADIALGVMGRSKETREKDAYERFYERDRTKQVAKFDEHAIRKHEKQWRTIPDESEVLADDINEEEIKAAEQAIEAAEARLTEKLTKVPVRKGKKSKVTRV